MNLTALKTHLREEEGTVLHAYPDHMGFLTIGTGRLIDKKKGGGITKEEADYLLENDISRILEKLLDALPWFDDQPEPVQIALMSMAFQMGVNGLLAFKTTLGLIRQGMYAHAADNALKSMWAKQTPERAKRVTDMIRNAKTKGA